MAVFSRLLPAGFCQIIQKTFGCDEKNAKRIMTKVTENVEEKHLVRFPEGEVQLSVFRLDESSKEDFCYAILTALLKARKLKPVEKLKLVMDWNRADIAAKDIFVRGQALCSIRDRGHRNGQWPTWKPP